MLTAQIINVCSMTPAIKQEISGQRPCLQLPKLLCYEAVMAVSGVNFVKGQSEMEHQDTNDLCTNSQPSQRQCY